MGGQAMWMNRIDPVEKGLVLRSGAKLPLNTCPFPA